MRRVFLLALCLTFPAAPVVATTVTLQDAWYAQLTNVEMYSAYGYPEWSVAGWWGQTQSSLITASAPTSSSARFDISAGTATVGQENAYVYGPIALSDYYGGIRFNWQTYWTTAEAAEHLRLEVWGLRYDMEAQRHHDLLVQITPGIGSHSGYSSTMFGGYQVLEVYLTVGDIPEPSGVLTTVSCLLGMPVLILRRKR